MARKDPIHNTYEEFPDELKETLQQAEKEQGQTPRSRAAREDLLQDHQWHLKFLAEGALPPRSLILPPPYPPSRTLTEEPQQIRMQDLRTGSRISNQLLLVRTVTEPYIYSSTVTIAEDEDGDAARLTICNWDDSTNDPAIPKDTILVLKQPCWSKVPGGGYHIRIDHPSDLCFISAENAIVPVGWRQGRPNAQVQDAASWKKEGNMVFLKKQFRTALQM
jgi:hypothetical protein